MEHSPETQPNNINFVNSPKMSEHEVDKKRNEHRSALLPALKDFLSRHERFQNKTVNVTFSHEGVSSLIAFLETPEEKLVMKIPLRDDFRHVETKFFQEWEKVGVRVPRIVEEGAIGTHTYEIMEFINAKTLSAAYNYEELLENKIFVAMGETLRTMHRAETEGFGRVLDGKPEFADFKSWLEKSTRELRAYVEKQALLSEHEHGSLDAAMETLRTHAKNRDKSAYCHYDYGIHNIFATDPLTVFDSDPRLNLPYIDLGRSIAIGPACDNSSKAANQFIEGYESSGEPVDRNVLQASILLNAYHKFPYWNKTKKQRRIRNVQKYLAETKHLLG